MFSFILVQKLNVTIHQSDQYIKIDTCLSEKDDCIIVILWEIHIVENLKIKMLVDMNILISEDIIMNLSKIK